MTGTEAIIPDNADVANAIGAIVGQIAVKVEVVITQPAEGRFQVTGIDLPFTSEEAAINAGEKLAREQIARLALDAGASEFETTLEQVCKRAKVEPCNMLIEARIIATASGRRPVTGQ